MCTCTHELHSQTDPTICHARRAQQHVHRSRTLLLICMGAHCGIFSDTRIQTPSTHNSTLLVGCHPCDPVSKCFGATAVPPHHSVSASLSPVHRTSYIYLSHVCRLLCTVAPGRVQYTYIHNFISICAVRYITSHILNACRSSGTHNMIFNISCGFFCSVFTFERTMNWKKQNIISIAISSSSHWNYK